MVTFSNDSGEIVNDSEWAKSFNIAFLSVFTKEPEFKYSMQPSIIQSKMPLITIKADGISSIIDNMKLSSSTGADEIDTTFLKNAKRISAIYLSLLFCQPLSKGIIPAGWKMKKNGCSNLQIR